MTPRQKLRKQLEKAKCEVESLPRWIMETPPAFQSAWAIDRENSLKKRAIIPHMLREANDNNFVAEVQMSSTPVLVEFFTPNCGPCRQLEPHLHRLASELSGALKVVKVNSIYSPQSATAFGVRMAPTLIVFKGGGVAGRINGNPGPQRLRSFVQAYL